TTAGLTFLTRSEKLSGAGAAVATPLHAIIEAAARPTPHRAACRSPPGRALTLVWDMDAAPLKDVCLGVRRRPALRANLISAFTGKMGGSGGFLHLQIHELAVICRRRQGGFGKEPCRWSKTGLPGRSAPTSATRRCVIRS